MIGSPTPPLFRINIKIPPTNKNTLIKATALPPKDVNFLILSTPFVDINVKTIIHKIARIPNVFTESKPNSDQL